MDNPAPVLTQAPANRPPRRRRISADILHAFASAVRREWDALDPADPRVRPTMPTLRFLRAEDGGPKNG
jgi:hypothetical protein